MITTEQVRRYASALPEVSEKNHFRFGVPVFQVCGRTFAGMGRDETTAVFCISEDDAAAAAAADPATYEAVRRSDVRRSFLGLQVRLERVSAERVAELVRQAWRQQAPSRVLATADLDGPLAPEA